MHPASLERPMPLFMQRVTSEMRSPAVGPTIVAPKISSVPARALELVEGKRAGERSPKKEREREKKKQRSCPTSVLFSKAFGTSGIPIPRYVE